PALSASRVGPIRDIEKNTFWGVAPFEGKLRTDMEAGLAKDPPPPELKALVDALLKAKNAIFWGKLDSDRLSIGLGLNCADPNSAGQVVTEMQAGWEKAKAEVAMVQLFLAPFPKSKQFLLEFMTSLQFSAQGNTAQGTASITRQTLNDTVQELVTLGAGMAGGGRGPGGAMPGGGMPGGGMGGMPGGGMGGM